MIQEARWALSRALSMNAGPDCQRPGLVVTNPVPCTWGEAAVKPAQGTRHRPALDRFGNPEPVQRGQTAKNRTSRLGWLDGHPFFFQGRVCRTPSFVWMIASVFPALDDQAADHVSQLKKVFRLGLA